MGARTDASGGFGGGGSGGGLAISPLSAGSTPGLGSTGISVGLGVGTARRPSAGGSNTIATDDGSSVAVCVGSMCGKSRINETNRTCSKIDARQISAKRRRVAWRTIRTATRRWIDRGLVGVLREPRGARARTLHRIERLLFLLIMAVRVAQASIGRRRRFYYGSRVLSTPRATDRGWASACARGS